MRAAEGEAKVARRPERAAASAGGWGSGRSLGRDRDVAGRPPPPAPPRPAPPGGVGGRCCRRFLAPSRGEGGGREAAGPSREVTLSTGRGLAVRVVEF